jgi:glycosyltransferase involved in cell wall biosynthesis
VNILIQLPKYSRLGASSRYRCYQYHPAMQDAGLKFIESSLFDDAYLASKYENGRVNFYYILRAFLSRIWRVLAIPKGSVVFIEYELIPYAPAILERWLKWRRCRLVVDYDDALFHQYDSHKNFWVRLFLSDKIATVMSLAHTVVVGNSYLADYAKRVGAASVKLIPSVIDLERYSIKKIVKTPRQFTIGWIGSPSTARYLKDIVPALTALCKDGGARVCLVGSGHIDLPGVQMEVISWCEDTEVNDIHRFDVGIMPLPNEPWTRGKCGFKLIQYMACGLPVVASPVGANCEIVEDGVNGYLASTNEEWVRALENLRSDIELRSRMGASGRKRVQEKYCLSVTAPRVVKLLKECAV